MNGVHREGRLSLFAAAMVVARRDFTAILTSRSFVFFLLGPLFMIAIGSMAGGVGQKVAESSERPVIGVAMAREEATQLIAARAQLSQRLGYAIPDFALLTSDDGKKARSPGATIPDGVSAVLEGNLKQPVLRGPSQRIAAWQGTVSMIAAVAVSGEALRYPPVALAPVSMERAPDRHGRMVTAQAGQTLLFLLTMLLAGMVLSNLVEEKSNKVIEILAAAIPMDAVFLGKLFAMLAVSMVAIAVWGLFIAGLFAAAGSAIPSVPAPAVGWPLFIALGVIYFSMAYLLLGSIFLSIGAMAATVRDVQTLSMPVTMMQLMVFFLATYAMTQPGTAMEVGAQVFPFSSPYMMIAEAARSSELWPHIAALSWQGLWVAIFIRSGAALFRRRVMQSGPAGSRTSLWRRLVRPARVET